MRICIFAALVAFVALPASGQQTPTTVTIHWDKTIRVSQTTATLQVVVNPPLQRGTPVHDNAFRALHDLGADYVRYVPWLPYPKLGVAELEPPKDDKASWDFSLIDPITVDFLEATRGHKVILNFSTIPQWMYKTDTPVSYPADPAEVTWKYEQGTELRDPTMKEVADYYARLLAWYTQGGFTDEFGRHHESGHHYAISHWEVLNEVDFEHNMDPETYTRLYDAVVLAMKKVQPNLKFVGLALASESNPHFFEYFLDHRNHKPGVPLDFISYHFYATPTTDQSPEIQQFTTFDQADGFVKTVRYIEAIRQRLSPETKTTIDEIGMISADDQNQGEPGHVTQAIPDSYWNLAGAEYAYVFGELAKLGIEIAGESQLVGYPTQFPSVSMVDWANGKPNARFWVLKLLHDRLAPGDKIVESELSNAPGSEHPEVYTVAFGAQNGRRTVLLVNKRNRSSHLTIPGAQNGQIEFVDQSTGSQPARSMKLNDDNVTLEGFGVAVVTFPDK